jgi:hypothetical protein
MAKTSLGADSAYANVIRLPRRRKRQTDTGFDAQVFQFPDRIGITAPAFNPNDESHAMIWQALWEVQTLYPRGRAAPKGHPLRLWYEQEFARNFPAPRRLDT